MYFEFIKKVTDAKSASEKPGVIYDLCNDFVDVTKNFIFLTIEDTTEIVSLVGKNLIFKKHLCLGVV